MPFFQTINDSLVAAEQENFGSEKSLQRLIEANLKAVLGCRFVASEFSTGALHAGRIDTLALPEDDNPVMGVLPSIARDVTDIGHFGTGDFEISIANEQDFQVAKPFIGAAYQRPGG